MEFTTSEKYMNSPLLKESFTLAALSVRLSRKTMNKDFGILAKQLIRSGTSVGANIKEAQNAQSGRDFVHKLKIAAKELDETEYWLFLIKVVCNNEIGYIKEYLKA